jgi:hypothetical protein
MCVKFQVQGNCTSRCPSSHYPKGDMTPADKAAITARFRTIFGC